MSSSTKTILLFSGTCHPYQEQERVDSLLDLYIPAAGALIACERIFVDKEAVL